MIKKKYSIILVLLFTFQYTYSFNKEKVDEVVNLYKNKLSLCFQSENQFFENQFLVYERFKSAGDSTHEYDFFGSEDLQTDLSTYLRLIAEDYNFQIKVQLEKTYIFDCPYYDKNTGKNYAVATFNKELNYNGQTKNVSYLLMIDTQSYLIETALIKELHQDIKISCSVDITDDRQKEVLLEASFLAKAQASHRSEDYTTAKRFYEQVLNINNKNQVAIEGLQDCNSLIKASMLITEIDKLIASKYYKSAHAKLSTLALEGKYSYSEQWFNTSNQKCIAGIKIQQATNKIKLADYYYNKKMYALAKKQYKAARFYNFRTAYIDKQIQECLKGDPNYVKKQITNAYYQAVASKKYYLNTFRLYVKYEQSGLLTGENYYFMCLMMLGDKKVTKGMGYSKSLARSLAREYFYKAKNKGCSTCDISFIENQVFTSNINKRH